METEEHAPVAELSEENKRARRRQLAQQAITLAMQARWQEALDVNEQIVGMAPEDAEAFNRLGKASTELGRVEEALQAYENSLRADPANLIAQRNIERLSRISQTEAAELARKAGQKLDPQFFTEETGKTGVTVLQEVAEGEPVTTLTAGDEVKPEAKDAGLAITTMDGAYVGRVDESLSARLVRLMQTGNEYRAGVVGVDGSTVRVIIREVSQSAPNTGKISFPPRASDEALPRPYVKEGLIRRAGEEDEDELEAEAGESDADEDDEDSSEFGFHEGTLDER